MQVKVDWQDNVHFVANNNSGHTVAMDGPPEQGGQDRGSRPMELMLMGLGGCTAFDVVDILRKGRQQVEGLSISIHAERADTVPAVFEAIEIHFHITGNALDPARVQRANGASGWASAHGGAEKQQTNLLSQIFGGGRGGCQNGPKS